MVDLDRLEEIQQLIARQKRVINLARLEIEDLEEEQQRLMLRVTASQSLQIQQRGIDIDASRRQQH